MKNLTTILLLCFATIACAQTNFRHISFEEAKAAAKAENKLVFVDFYTSWCGPCKMMANTVFPQEKVGKFMNSKFVNVKYDAEKEELELVKQSNITAYPTFIIFDAEGKEIGRKVGGGTADEFVDEIDRLSNTELTPEKIRARYEAGDRSTEIVKAYTGQLRAEVRDSRRGNPEKEQQIKDIISDYFNGLTDAQKLDKENQFLYSNYTENTSDPKMQYLFANRDKVAAADRAEVDSILAKAYKYEGYYYVSFRRPFVKSDYETYRTQVKELGLVDPKDYNAILTVMDAYNTGDMDKYIDAVKKTSAKCEESMGYTLMSGFENGLKDASKETKLKASKFLRSKLADMPYNEIYFMAMTIGSLEGERNSH